MSTSKVRLPLTVHDGHLIVSINGRKALIDTGCPVTLGVGTPLLTVPMMALVLPPQMAIAIMAIPVVVANLWQFAQAERSGAVCVLKGRGSVVTADLDGDRDTDVIVVRPSGSQIWINDRLWQYRPASGFDVFGSAPLVGAVVGDRDADGRPEIYTLDNTGSLQAWTPSQDGGWSPSSVSEIDGDDVTLALADLDGVDDSGPNGVRKTQLRERIRQGLAELEEERLEAEAEVAEREERRERNQRSRRRAAARQRVLISISGRSTLGIICTGIRDRAILPNISTMMMATITAVG